MKITAVFGRHKLFWLGLALAILTVHSNAHCTSKAELWPRWQQHDPANTQTMDHSRWQAFLQKLVVTNHPSGINRVRYQALSAADFTALQGYIGSMQEVTISNYNRAEQKAFWINVYNALTVHLVVSRDPVASTATSIFRPVLQRAVRGVRSCFPSKMKKFLWMISNIVFSVPFGRTAERITR